MISTAEPIVDCSGCLAPCCSNFTLGALGTNYAGIAIGPRVTPAESAVLMSEVWEFHTAGRAQVRLSDGPVHPDVEEFGVPSPNLRCTAVGGDGLCTVYADRPYGCRIYDCRNDPDRNGDGARCEWPRRPPAR